MAVVLFFEETEEMEGNITGSPEGKELQSKANFAMVIENKKPESDNSGYDKNLRDSMHESADGSLIKSIIADTPNFYNKNGTAMENSGYFIIPRSVTSDPRYQGARLKYKHVLHILLENFAFAPTTHAIVTEVIPIAIGQFCVSERRLVELCNEGVKFKEDLVDRNIVTRAVQFFCKCQYLSQEVIHGKTLLTVLLPEFYERKKKTSDPASDPKPSQNRASKEEDKELKTDNNISSVADAPSEKKKISSSSPSKKRKKAEPVPLVERDKGVFISDIAHQKLVQEKGSEEIVKQIYSAMSVWKAQNGIAGGDDYRTAIRWSLTPAKSHSPVSYTKPPSKHNNPSFKPKVETPLAYNNKLSFNTEKK